ncbi:MAG: hypothetical protein AAF560_01805 [Acidobacteriota bacterium]
MVPAALPLREQPVTLLLLDELLPDGQPSRRPAETNHREEIAMAFDGFKESALAEILKLAPLAHPVSDLPNGKWDHELSLGADAEEELGDLTSVTLRGDVEAALCLTHGSQPSDDLESFEPEPDAVDDSVASVVIDAAAGAAITHSQDLGSTTGLDADLDTAASLKLALHRRYPSSDTGVVALVDVLKHLRNPYDAESYASLVEHELFHVELTGSGSLVAAAGWEWGLVRSFEGTAVDKLAPSNLGGVQANVKAGVSVMFGLTGELKVLVDRSPRDPAGWVRVRLHRKRGRLVGAGLALSATVRLTQSERFVDSVAARLLRVPDTFVAELTELHTGLEGLRQSLAGLEDSIRQTISAAASVAESALGIDQLDALVLQIDQLPPDLAEPLRAFVRPFQEIKERIDEIESELSRSVDATFRTADRPLASLTPKIGRWLDAYDQARNNAVTFLIDRAREGVTAELAAGINRSRTSEALLELDFELATTPALLVEAIKGNFTPAIERAQSPGATGVEIAAGSLKQITKSSRFFNLRFNFFGFTTRVDFQRFNDVTFDTNPKTGIVTITGQSGAALLGETQRQLQEISFLVDVYGAIDQSGDRLLTSPRTNFRATLDRSGVIHRPQLIEATLPRHLRGARRLGLIGDQRELEIRQALLGAEGDYSYELLLAFPPSAIPRMFSLDLADSTPQLRQRLWGWMRQALDALDYPVPHPKGVVPLSSFINSEVIPRVEDRPVASGWRELSEFRGIDQLRFEEGAYRMAWAYLLNARAFISAYLETRNSLRSGQRLHEVQKHLVGLSSKTVKGVGSFTTRPFDAKYLVFALAEGLKEVDITLTFRRGEVDLTI